MTTIHDFKLKTIDGQMKSLADYRGKVLLVVNVASRCGLTPQYKALEEVYREYQEDGFEVLGFPCNDFAGQEPAAEAEIKTFCSTNYDVTFPLFGKVKVLGDQKDPLYDYLTKQATQPDGPGDISWNFAKFVIGKDGQVVARFSPKVAPDDADIAEAIERALGAD
ncbi:MAG: glutathione peroxidase [Myxococcales bacterium]